MANPLDRAGPPRPSFGDPLRSAPLDRADASQRSLRRVVVAVLVALFALYAWMPPGALRTKFDPRGDHRDQYNLLTDGMLSGHLYLNEFIPPGLHSMADPYNPATNGQYRYKYGLWDQSYYKGRCYLYFGVTPVVTLYLPFRVITRGLRAPNALATLAFAYGSLLFGAGLILTARRRYFPRTPPWMTGAAIALFGTADVACYLLSQSNIYQVAIASGMCFSLGGLYFLTRAVGRTPRRAGYLAAAGTCLALAVGSRPHFAVTTTILFAFATTTLWRRGDRHARHYAALTGPLAAGGALLGLYNYLRFDNPLEFGARYQLGIIDMIRVGMFHLENVPSMLYFMFLQPPTFNKVSPYIHPMPKLPPWLSKPPVFVLERVTGLLTSTPFLWLILPAAVVAYVRLRRGREAKPLPVFELACLGACIAALVSILSLTVGTMRYLADFAALLDLTAVFAWFYLERSTAPGSNARLASRAVGLGLLVVSVAIAVTLALPPPYHYMDG